MMDQKITPEDHERSREAFAAAISEVVASVDDSESFGAAVSQMTQLAGQLDPQLLLDTPSIPEGGTADQEAVLRAMLERVPNGFGRWVDCGPGWYPILITLHTKLLELVPDYKIHQIKEKFGGLRFYWGGGGTYDDTYPGDPADVRPQWEGTSEEVGESERWKAHNELCAQWRERSRAWWQTEEGQTLRRHLDAVSSRAQALVDEAERLSLETCEVCGAPGQLCCTAAASPWYRTVCVEHRDGMMPAEEWSDWWAEHEPRFKAWLRGNFLRRHGDRQAVVLCADPDRRIILPQARYISDPVEARAYADAESFDMVFVATDPVGQAFMRGLEERYRAHGQAVLAEQKRRKGAGDNYAVNTYRPKPEGAPAIHHLDHANWFGRAADKSDRFTTINTMEDGIYLSGWTYQEHFDDGPTLPEDAW